MAATSEESFTLIVFEPVLTGHHETLLRQYLRLFCEMPLHVRLLCTKSDLFSGESWMEKALDQNRLSFGSLPEGWGQGTAGSRAIRLLLSSLADVRQWLCLRQEIKKILRVGSGGQVAVYFMFLGSKPFFRRFFWNWCIPVPWAALCALTWRAPRRMRGTVLGRIWEKTGTAGPESALCRRIFCWRGESERFLRENVGPGKMEIVADSTDLRLPDGVPGWLQGLADNLGPRKVVCLVGAVLPRKGVRAFLLAAQELIGHPVSFVIAGEVYWDSFDKATSSMLRRASDRGQEGITNLFILDQRIEDEADLNWIVKHSTVCYLAYVGFDGSSNVLSKAAAFNVPVIVSDGTVLADSCRQHDLGWVVPADDAGAVAAAVLQALLEEKNCRLARGFSGYSELHSEDALKVQLQKMVSLLKTGPPAPTVD